MVTEDTKILVKADILAELGFDIDRCLAIAVRLADPNVLREVSTPAYLFEPLGYKKIPTEEIPTVPEMKWKLGLIAPDGERIVTYSADDTPEMHIRQVYLEVLRREGIIE